jgi:hypothetical protein
MAARLWPLMALLTTDADAAAKSTESSAAYILTILVIDLEDLKL